MRSMAIVRTQDASLSTFHWSYHVFLSFRGEDTRKTFVDHLYTALVSAGIRTFKDDEQLERGENISSEIHKAIQESNIAIIVFSKNYPSSSWCLDELVEIFEHKKNINGHIILPIFYHMNPSEVKKHVGNLENALTRQKEQLKLDTDQRKKEALAKVERWKAALREVTDLVGMVLQDEHESKFIQKIIRVIKDKLNRKCLSDGPYIVGIDSQAKGINLWLQERSKDTNILVICGMSGIGKTTLAKFVYNLHFEQFEGSSFLANISEVSQQPNGSVRLQKQLLSDILKGRRDKIWNVDEGLVKIKDAIQCKRVLIVLDDVDQVELLDTILGMRKYLYPGSKIIITTRRKQLLLDAHDSYKLHEVEKMDDGNSLGLFCWHAFGQNHPFDAFRELSKVVVSYCQGLPLALQVLGSSLSGKTINVWESAINKMKEIPENQILRKIRISYDLLEDDHDQRLFLDIACFFVGKDQDFTITVLDGCGFHTKVGVQNLIDRFLITVNGYNKLEMHQLVQDMGREIVRQESARNPGERSRLCRHKDVIDVLREKTGTGRIEGLILNLPVSYHKPIVATTRKRKNSEGFLNKSTVLYEGNPVKRCCLGFFSWFSISGAFTKVEEESLQTAAFSQMHKLRLLQLYNVQLSGGFKEFPKKLIWLFWSGFSLGSIPSDFLLEHVVVLEMPHSSLKQVWKGNKLLTSLKILNLRHCQYLTEVPNLSTVPNLEKVILEGCISLVEIHASIGELRSLVLLNLRNCRSLCLLPEKICELKSLETLDLSGCSKLKKLPSELAKMESLKILRANGINLSHSTVVRVKPWHASWPWVSKFIKDPVLSLPCSLTVLRLEGCNICDRDFPKDLSSLSRLQFLDLSENPICSLKERLGCLTRLNTLVLHNCKRLQSIGQLPMSLQRLDTSKCKLLRMAPKLLESSKISHLGMRFCEKLADIHGFFKLEPRPKLPNLGWEEMAHMIQQKVRLYNRRTNVLKFYPLQGFDECGIFSVFFPGKEIPECFTKDKKIHFSISEHSLLSPPVDHAMSHIRWRWLVSPISFTVPYVLPNRKLQAINICVVYTCLKPLMVGYQNQTSQLCKINIRNQTQGVEWTYSRAAECFPDDNDSQSEMRVIWLNHWKIGDRFKLEGGDEVVVNLLYLHMKDPKTYKVEIQLVYGEQEPGSSAHSNDRSSNDADDDSHGGALTLYSRIHGG